MQSERVMAAGDGSMEACNPLHLNMVNHEVYYRQGHLGAQHMNDQVADGKLLTAHLPP